MDLEKCGRTGVWGELLPRVREAQGGQRSTGGHQTQAVLLAQEILREDAAGRGLLGPVACRAGLALVWVHSGRRWPGVCVPISFSDLAPALPSAARGSPCFPSPLRVRSFSRARGMLPGGAGQRRTAISLGRTRPLTSVASILLPGCSRAAVVTSLSRAGARLTFSSLCELDPASRCSLLKQI